MICIHSSSDMRYKSLTFLLVTKNNSVRYKPVDSQISWFIQKLERKELYIFEYMKIYLIAEIPDTNPCTKFDFVRLKIFHVLLHKIYKLACKINTGFQQKGTGIHFHRTYLYKPNQTNMRCSILWHSYTQQKIVYMYAYFNMCCEFMCLQVQNFITRIIYSQFQIVPKWNRKLLSLPHLASFFCK